jgi:hypothetical protein
MQNEERKLIERLELLSLEKEGLERRLKLIRGRNLMKNVSKR